MSNLSNVLSFDHGTRYIGIAIGNLLIHSARPLLAITAHQGIPNWTELDDLVNEWAPTSMIVGLPLNLEGGEQPASYRSRRFADRLTKRYHLDVHLVDERHSSQEAARNFAAQRALGLRRRHHAEDIDAFAAAIILETWFSEMS